MNVIYCSTFEEAARASSTLFASSTIYIDLEGVSLGRDGQVCLIQCMGENTPVFVFDTMLIGIPEALRQMLESNEWCKYTWDPRGDSDALYHSYGIVLHNVICLQLAEVAYDRLHGGIRKHVSGLAKSLNRFLPHDVVELVDPLKRHVKTLFSEDPAIFARRPLSEGLVYYAALDVAILQVLKGLIWDSLPAQQQMWVVAESQRRIDLAFRSEPLPTGCDATLAPVEEIPVVHPLLLAIEGKCI